MSGGAPFNDPTILVPETTPEQRRRAGIVLVDLAQQAGASLEELQDALEMVGLLPYESAPGYVNGYKPGMRKR